MYFQAVASYCCCVRGGPTWYALRFFSSKKPQPLESPEFRLVKSRKSRAGTPGYTADVV